MDLHWPLAKVGIAFIELLHLSCGYDLPLPVLFSHWNQCIRICQHSVRRLHLLHSNRT